MHKEKNDFNLHLRFKLGIKDSLFQSGHRLFARLEGRARQSSTMTRMRRSTRTKEGAAATAPCSAKTWNAWYCLCEIQFPHLKKRVFTWSFYRRSRRRRWDRRRRLPRCPRRGSRGRKRSATPTGPPRPRGRAASRPVVAAARERRGARGDASQGSLTLSLWMDLILEWIKRENDKATKYPTPLTEQYKTTLFWNPKLVEPGHARCRQAKFHWKYSNWANRNQNSKKKSAPGRHTDMKIFWVSAIAIIIILNAVTIK